MRHAPALYFAALLMLVASAAAYAQSASDTSRRLRWPVDGVQAAAKTPVDPGKPESSSGAWTKFFNSLGVAVPDPWSGGFNLAGRGITFIPSQPYPATTVTGDINLVNDRIASVPGLSSLKMVDGSLNLSSDSITNVDGLSSLQGVGGLLMIEGASLTNVDGLSKLYGAGNITIGGHKLISIAGLSNLHNVSFTLNITNTAITNVDGLSSLQTVGTLYLDMNYDLVDLSGLSNVRLLGGAVYIDAGIQKRPGFVPIHGGALCDASNAGQYFPGMGPYATQVQVCASVH